MKSRPRPTSAPRTPAEAVRRLVAGNAVFTRMATAAASGRSILEAQRPFAAVLGCADARVPIEMVFQQRSNDLFVVRVAGNGIGLGGLGSFRYAVRNFAESLRLLVVLGHSQCGAVTAAVDAFLRPRDYLPLAGDYPLRSLVDGILVAVRAASLALEGRHGPAVASRRGYRAALVEASVVLNAAFSAFSLERELGTPRCRVVFGRYDLATGRLRLPLAVRAAPALVEAPRDEGAFRRLAEAVAASPQVATLLGDGGR